MRDKEQEVVMKPIPLYLLALCSAASGATEINVCKDLIGTWKTTADNPH